MDCDCLCTLYMCGVRGFPRVFTWHATCNVYVGSGHNKPWHRCHAIIVLKVFRESRKEYILNGIMV